MTICQLFGVIGELSKFLLGRYMHHVLKVSQMFLSDLLQNLADSDKILYIASRIICHRTCERFSWDLKSVSTPPCILFCGNSSAEKNNEVKNFTYTRMVAKR